MKFALFEELMKWAKHHGNNDLDEAVRKLQLRAWDRESGRVWADEVLDRGGLTIRRA